MTLQKQYQVLNFLSGNSRKAAASKKANLSSLIEGVAYGRCGGGKGRVFLRRVAVVGKRR
ncbi:Hypothetical protein AT6N2_L0865 [Agrobacterium tumefaciens]|nr:Hypothetical protein AT6N2_L0865 [Agrobacterium tumefaciens]